MASQTALACRSHIAFPATLHPPIRRTDIPAAGSEERNVPPKGGSNRCYRLSDFDILRTLGTGSFGRVHLGKFSCLTLYYRVSVRLPSRVLWSLNFLGINTFMPIALRDIAL